MTDDGRQMTDDRLLMADDRHHYLKHKIVNKRYFEAIDKTFSEDISFKCGDCKKEFGTMVFY